MNADQGTEFLNVDLEIFSRTRLDPLVEAFGEKVFVLGVRQLGRLYFASVELNEAGTPDKLIRRMVALVKKLPRPARSLWNRAKSRDFNIGIEAAARSTAFELRLESQTLEAVTTVDGRIIITVYAPERLPKSHGGRKRWQ
jgi:hypothetical protein